jgi:hypothetical protein
MSSSPPARLLTTRTRCAVALGLTGFVFALAIRDVLLVSHAKRAWPFVLHGWPGVALNVFFYGYVCWLGFWLIRGTSGTERVFMTGWFAGILLSPLRALRPHWNGAITEIAAIGLAVSVLAALALLLNRLTSQSDATSS